MATNKQKRLAKKILENPSMDDITSADMVEIGYSPNTRPNEIVKSKGWNELLEKYMPDDKLMRKHDQLLEATKVVSARTTGKDADSQTDDFIDVPDYQTQYKALELGYKVKGKLKDTNINTQINIAIPILGELKAE
jgi:hypothetical protein